MDVDSLSRQPPVTPPPTNEKVFNDSLFSLEVTIPHPRDNPKWGSSESEDEWHMPDLPPKHKRKKRKRSATAMPGRASHGSGNGVQEEEETTPTPAPEDRSTKAHNARVPPPPPLPVPQAQNKSPAKPEKKKNLGPVPPPPILPRSTSPPTAVSLPLRANAMAPIASTSTRKLDEAPLEEESSSIEIMEASSAAAAVVAKEKQHDSKGKGKAKALSPPPQFVRKEQKSVAPSAESTPPPPVNVRGKKRGRKSGEDILADDSRSGSKYAQLYKLAPTISAYLSRLQKHPFEKPHAGPLSDCRIVYINALNSKPNEMDRSVPLNIKVLTLSAGATVVAPEDFKPSPPEYRDTPEWNAKAVEERWTTHIVTLEKDDKNVRTKFSAVARHVGDVGKGGVKDLGTFVHVVPFPWVTQCVAIKAKASEWPFYLEGDPRKSTYATSKPTSKQSRNGGVDLSSSPRKPHWRRERGARSPETEDETSSASDGGGADDGEKAAGTTGISPFGAGDWPKGEAPIAEPSPPVQEAVPDSAPTRLPSSSHALAYVSAANNRFEGLEDQIELVNQVNDVFDGDEEGIDEFLNSSENDVGGASVAGQEEEDLMIYSTREDDFETDKENDSDEEKKRPSKRIREDHKYICEVSSTGGAKEEGPNEFIAKQFVLLAAMCEPNSFRQRGYTRGAAILRNRDKAVRTYDEAIKIPGIGESLATKLVEIVKTGKHRRVGMVSEKLKVTKLFQGIYGIGLNIAEDLYNRGCRSLNDLVGNTKVALTDSQKLGLEYYDDLQKRIPRVEVEELYQHAVEAGKEIDPKLEIYCMGSYRRGQPDCGDMDLLVTRNTQDGKDHRGMIKKLYTILKRKGIIRHGLSQPDEWNALDAKFMGLAALSGGLMRRIDILGVPWDELPAALIYFTGSDFFNRSMRLKARHLGLRLNQRGLYANVMRDRQAGKPTGGSKIDCKTEEDIFQRLGVTWRPPNERMP